MTVRDRDPLSMALALPQMFAGVTYSRFVASMMLATELVLIFHSIRVLAVVLVVHLAGILLCERGPRFLDLG